MSETGIRNCITLIAVNAQSIQSVPISPGICHFVSPGGGKFVRKPLQGGGAFVNSSRIDSRRG